MRKLLAFITAAAISIAALSFGFSYSQKRASTAALEKHIITASAIIAMAAEHDSKPFGAVGPRETFTRIDKGIADIEQALLDTKRPTRADPKEVQAASELLTATQELLRSLREKNEAEYALIAAGNAYQEARFQWISSIGTEAGSDFRFELMKRAEPRIEQANTAYGVTLLGQSVSTISVMSAYETAAEFFDAARKVDTGPLTALKKSSEIHRLTVETKEPPQ